MLSACLILFLGSNHLLSETKNIEYHNLFIDKDFESILILNQLKDGSFSGLIIGLGGSDAAKTVYTTDPVKTSTFIQDLKNIAQSCY